MNPVPDHTGLTWRLKDADRAARLFITSFLCALTFGYLIGLFFVGHTSSGTMQGLTEEYRGTPESRQEAELKYAKSADEMYIFLHNHVISLSLVFLTVGTIFYFSSSPSGLLKEFIIAEPFIAILTTFGGIWLMRFVSENFNWLVVISGVSMVGCYFTMVTIILKELWWRR